MNNTATTTFTSLGSIILAGGKGKRMGLTETNKVTLILGNKPIIQHIVHFMKNIGLEKIIVVVGHAKESVMNTLQGERVLFAEQTEQLGTGHAVAIALEKLAKEVTDVFVVYGDDAVIYIDDHISIIRSLFEKHFQMHAALTFLTINVSNPQGLGRIVRDVNDEVLAIVEEKDATNAQRKICEINPGCFVFNVEFLKNYLPKVKKSPVTGEYYLTSLIDMAIENKEIVETVKGGRLAWRGVNTPDELKEAEQFFTKGY